MSYPPCRSPPLAADRLENLARVRHPAEDAALRLDHLQAHFLELRKVRADAVLRDQAVVAAVVGFAHGGVDAHFCGDAGHHELGDAAMLKDRVKIGGVK